MQRTDYFILCNAIAIIGYLAMRNQDQDELARYANELARLGDKLQQELSK